MTYCKHCGLEITAPDPRSTYWVHAEGSYRGKGRCGSESNLPYGYNADPVDAPCNDICLGSSPAVERLDSSNPRERLAAATEIIDEARAGAVYRCAATDCYRWALRDYHLCIVHASEDA